jgi:hypothetical protein
MFSVDERDAVRARLLRRAGDDPDVVAAAITGSLALGGGDRWSDIDLAFGVEGPLEPCMRRWTDFFSGDLAAVHHWDLPSGAAIYRVFLLPNALEVDIAFTPAGEFGARGPNWRTVFGHPRPPSEAPAPSRRDLIGRAWHHALHARVGLRRGRWWQAEHWIGALRGQILELACLRLGHPTSYAKGAHLLPADVTAPLAATLVRALDEAELTRALDAAAAALIGEVALVDPPLAGRLAPILTGPERSGPSPATPGR